MSYIHRVRPLPTTSPTSYSWVLSWWERPKCLPLHQQKSQSISGLTAIVPSTQEAISIRLHHAALLVLEHRLQDIPGSIIQPGVIVSFFPSISRHSDHHCKASCTICLPAAFNGLFGLRASYGVASRRGIIPKLPVLYRLIHRLVLELILKPKFDTVGMLHRSIKDAKKLITATLDVPDSSQVSVSPVHTLSYLAIQVS